MEGEKKRRGGWWALAVVAVLTLLGLYVGAYYATVLPTRDATLDTFYEPTQMVPMYGPDSWGQFQSFAQPFFWPISQVDRKIRPAAWKAPPPTPHLW